MFKKISNFSNKIKSAIGNFFFRNRYGTVMFLVGCMVAFWDLVLKYLLDDKKMPALNGVFSINSTHNTGGAWSIFSNNTLFLIIITIVFLFAILFINYAYKRKDYFYAISMGLLFGGAICNLFDRIKYGYVRDFIELEFINFPIFNIADIAITISVILLVVYFIFISPKYEEKYYTDADDISVKFINNYKIIKPKNIKDDEKVNNKNNQKNTKRIKNNNKDKQNKAEKLNKNNNITIGKKSNKSTKNVKAKNAK